eukprot:snap_masked-scaffold_78-processed-gene-0.32-mRNA-1 protein AED:1.00 eAED:1.00 QI:0/-1/0/0/-1/1/1/0/289
MKYVPFGKEVVVTVCGNTIRSHDMETGSVTYSTSFVKKERKTTVTVVCVKDRIYLHLSGNVFVYNYTLNCVASFKLSTGKIYTIFEDILVIFINGKLSVTEINKVARSALEIWNQYLPSEFISMSKEVLSFAKDDSLFVYDFKAVDKALFEIKVNGGHSTNSKKKWNFFTKTFDKSRSRHTESINNVSFYANNLILTESESQKKLFNAYSGEVVDSVDQIEDPYTFSCMDLRVIGKTIANITIKKNRILSNKLFSTDYEVSAVDTDSFYVVAGTVFGHLYLNRAPKSTT